MQIPGQVTRYVSKKLIRVVVLLSFHAGCLTVHDVCVQGMKIESDMTKFGMNVWITDTAKLS